MGVVENVPKRLGWSQTNSEVPLPSCVSAPGGLSCAAIKVRAYADDISLFVVEEKKESCASVVKRQARRE